MKLRTSPSLQMTELEVLEALADDDPFLQRYPTMDAYLAALLRELGMDNADAHTLYELYANHIDPEDVVNIWEIYDAETNHD